MPFLLDPVHYSPMKNPKVSVLLPAYNAAEHLGKAITSILGQTFTDFELIIINDGSTDDTLELLNNFSDPRIQVIHQENLGLPKALNAGIKASSGMYLARQDADDISLSERLEKQVNFLDTHSSYGLVGSWSQIMTPGGMTSRQHLHPISNGQLQVRLLTNNQFVHSSVMMRASCLNITGLYSENPEHFPPEDYDLWLKFSQHFQVANLPEVLIHYLEVPTSISRTKELVIQTRAAAMSKNAIMTLGIDQRNTHLIGTFIEAVNGRPIKFSLANHFNLEKLISNIDIAIQKRFPDERKEIAKSSQYLRAQIRKALIKAFIRRHK